MTAERNLPPTETAPRRGLGAWGWRIAGSLFFVLGGIGLFLPVWPTTGFWILAAVCFTRSNPAWRDWIYGRPKIGPVVENFVERGVLGRRAKVAALMGMCLSAGIVAWALWTRPIYLTAALALIGVGMVYVATRRSA